MAASTESVDGGRRAGGLKWFGQIEIAYDPTYGYVTRLESEASGLLSIRFGYISDSHYVYTAGDLVVAGPR